MRRVHGIAVALLALGVMLTAVGCAGGRDVTVGQLESEPTLGPIVGEKDEWEPTDRWDRSGRHGPAQIRSAVAGYLRSRSLDFWDMFEAGLSVGPWVRVEAQYLVGFYGFGWTDCERWRVGQRSAILDEENTMFSTLPFPASLLLFPLVLDAEDDTVAKMVVLGGISYESECAIWPNPVFRGLKPELRRVRMACVERDPITREFRVTPESLALGLEGHVLVGLRARVMPLQILDFLAGLLGFDPLGDDVRPYRAD